MGPVLHEEASQAAACGAQFGKGGASAEIEIGSPTNARIREAARIASLADGSGARRSMLVC
jgi:hypothetical protein